MTSPISPEPDATGIADGQPPPIAGDDSSRTFTLAQVMPTSPRRRKVWPLMLGAVAVTVVVFVGMAVALVGGGVIRLAGTGASATPAAHATTGLPPWATTPAAQSTPKGPQTLAKAVGDTIIINESSRITGALQSVVAYTVSSVTTASGSPNGFSRPQHGVYVVASATVAVTEGSHYACECEFQLVAPDGTTYDATFGDFQPEMHAANLQAGQKIAGNVVFDVPKVDVHQYVVHLNLGGNDVNASWRI